MTNVISLQEFRPGSLDLLDEANHRIANHLAMVVGLIQGQVSSIRRGPEWVARDAAGAMLREAAAKIVSVAHLHRRLAGYSHESEINLGGLLIESINEIALTLSIGDRLSVRQTLSNNCIVNSDQASVLTLIVNEIVMNAVKYAHPAEIPVELTVSCTQGWDGRAVLEIADDGVGFPEGFDENDDAGVGLKLIRALAKRIGATVAIESDDLGLCYRFQLPKRRTESENDPTPPARERDLA